MGGYLSRFYELFSSWSSAGPSRILLLGLDCAGKTSLLYKVKLNENISTIPTIGFNVETVSPIKGITFTVWDVGGQEKIRRLWNYYYQNTDGLFFVVDSSDVERMNEASEELHTILNNDCMYGVPVVVIANKQDLPRALPCGQIVQRLKLDQLKSKNKWYIQASCAVTGEGVYEAMQKMAEFVKEKRN